LRKKCDDALFTLEIDRQIIEGFLKDQETLLAKLEKEHFSNGAILMRATELGMNKDFFELKKRGGGKPAARKCLRCGRYFASLGAHNRLCKKCRKE
jgi:Zinc finger found in FPG and IleRS